MTRTKKNIIQAFMMTAALIAFSSCQPEEYTKEKCNELSQKSFKGMPKAAKEFQDHCQGVPIKYTKEACQKALNDLILTGDYGGVLEKHGKQAAGCFTENDINKFRKR